MDLARKTEAELLIELHLLRQHVQELELEAHARRAQTLESLAVLAAGIAHDFNNLLTSVLSGAALARDALPADSPARPAITHIEQAAHRAAELTRQMLLYAGKGRRPATFLDLSRLVDEMRPLLQASVSKQAVLQCDLADTLPLIEADPDQIQLVVTKLIANASESLAGQPGVIRVRTGTLAPDAPECAVVREGERPTRSCVFLEISDTGSGMDAKTQARMFEPYFTTKSTGRGLSLATVLGIVREHAGAIGLTSELGRGTTIRVLLPAATRVPPPSPDPSTSPAAQRGGGTVLVVDDEASVRAVAQRSLAAAGFVVLTAANGEDALAVLRERAAEIRAVVLDLKMPVVSGEDVLHELRRRGITVPVILTSGYTEHDTLTRLAGACLAGYIQKPFRPSALVDKVLAVLKQEDGTGEHGT